MNVIITADKLDVMCILLYLFEKTILILGWSFTIHIKWTTYCVYALLQLFLGKVIMKGKQKIKAV